MESSVLVHGAGHGALHALAPAAGVVSGLAIVLAKVKSARMLTVRLALLALRSTAPIAFFASVRILVAFGRHKHHWHPRRILKRVLTAWALAEALFWFYIMEYGRRLNSQTTRRWQAVPVHSTEERRAKSLDRYLLSFAQVSSAGPMNHDDAKTSRNRATSGTQNTLRRNAPSRGGPGSLGRQRGMSGDNFLSRVTSFSSSSNLFGSGSMTPRNNESVADLMKLWDDQENVSAGDLQRLKLLEMAAFFHGPGRGDCDDITQWLRRENVEEWIAHYWFRGARPQDLDSRRGEREELRRMVNTVLRDAGVEHMASGYNPAVQCYRVCLDPLPVAHRPLFVYGVTSLLCPLMTMQYMKLLGFHRERVGGLGYWRREPRRDVSADQDLCMGPQTPMVFIHGLGVGLVPYYLFLARVSRRHSGVMLVPDFPFLACAPWESVPSAREVVAQLQDMLAANNFTAAHFVGHSFGSLIIGWLLKMSPSVVTHTTLMEPAQFLMMKSDCLCKVLYDPPQSCFEMLVRYFAFRELFTVNLLCRNFFWEQSTMWPEEIVCPAVIELAGADHVVQSLFVRRLVEHERAARKQLRKNRQQKRTSIMATGSSADIRSDILAQKEAQTTVEALEVCWFEGYLHGEILMRPRSQDKVFSKMRQMRLQSEKEKDNGFR